MDKKKHKRIEDGIMKPADLKKARIQRVGIPGSSTSSSSGIKAKLDFRSNSISNPKSSGSNINSGSSLLSNNSIRPVLDDKWMEFGDTINLNILTFAKSIEEAIQQEKFNKVARMIVAALKSFISEEKMTIEFRLLGSIANAIKNHGDKLNHLAVHRGLLYLISYSRIIPVNIVQLLMSILTSLAKQQEVLDRCYIISFLHDAIGSNTGLGTQNRCSWIEKPYSQELVQMILQPFSTIFPQQETYTACQLEHFGPADYFAQFTFEKQSTSNTQIAVFLEFLKPWFDNIRGEMIPKSLFRCLGILCGCDQIRHFIVTRLDIWITWQKFHREISELLLILGCNLDASNETDRESLELLLKLNSKNMKTRTVTGPFHVAIRKACENPINVRIIFELLVFNEIGVLQNRSISNLPMMHMLIGCQPVESTSTLAKCCANELFREKENSVKLLRGFLRELIRGFNHSRNGEFPFSIFASAFLASISSAMLSSDTGVDEELTKLACELLAQVPLSVLSSLLITRENAFSIKYNVQQPGGGYPIIPIESKLIREKFQNEFRLYCEAVAHWLGEEKVVFKTEIAHIRSYYLLLYLEKQRDIYTNIDAAAVLESEIGNCIRIFGECGITENLIFLIFGKDVCPIPSKTAMEIVTLLTQRAAQFYPRFFETPLIEFSSQLKLIEKTLKMSIYPKNEVERNEEEPFISIKSIYWNAWILIVIWLCGANISSHFEKIYNSYPTLRYLIFVIMLRKYEFPLDFEGKSAEVLGKEHSELLENENKILQQYERKLMRPNFVASSCIFSSKDVLRCPPSFDELRMIADKYRLASRLCRCESPPLLSNLINQVGAQKSLAAIIEMISVDSSSVEALTSECLFHAVVYHSENSRREEDVVLKSLLKRSEKILKSTEPIEDDFLIHTLISSLSSDNKRERAATVNIFNRLFPTETYQFDIFELSKLKRFEENKSKYLESIGLAVTMETDLQLCEMYLKFLANCFEKDSMHKVAKTVCQTVENDRYELRNAFCEFFVNYVDSCIELHKFQKGENTNLENELKIVEIATTKFLINAEAQFAIIRLLSKYETELEEKKDDDKYFEMLVEVWLSPGSKPKFIDNNTGDEEDFLSLAMKKEMLKSRDHRVIEAALEGMSEQEAEEFVMVSQMSAKTAEKIIEKAENMNVENIEKEKLSNMYLIVRGYRLKGVKSGEKLLEKVKKRLDEMEKEFEVKDEPMIIDEVIDKMPRPFIERFQEENSSFQVAVKQNQMQTTEIIAWLKANYSAMPQKSQVTISSLPPSFVQSALIDEKSSLACLQHIEANLKFFLSHESIFQTLIVIVDTASHKFQTVAKRIETLAVKLLKSVNPPVGVCGVLKKHAAKVASLKQTDQKNLMEIGRIDQLAAELEKCSGNEKKKAILNDFIWNYVGFENDEFVQKEDIFVMLKSMWEIYNEGSDNEELTAEKCISKNWSPQLTKVVCQSILDNYQKDIPAILIFHLVYSYCRIYPIASYRELFLEKNVNNRNSITKKVAFRSLSIYFADVASKNEEYDLNILDLITIIEKEGGVQAGLSIAESLILCSCSHLSYSLRKSANRLLEMFADRFPYLTYKNGVACSVRILSNVESRESWIRKCELIVEKIVEIQNDADLALMEDICEEDRPIVSTSKDDDEKSSTPTTSIGSKRGASGELRKSGHGGAKKGKWISGREAANIGGMSDGNGAGSGGGGDMGNDDGVKWNNTTTAMAQFSAMIREHPSIVKTKFPVLANFVSTLTNLTRKELKDEHRVEKVELVLSAVISLCSHMKNDELSAIEMALTNCFEFYVKHVEEGLVHHKKQIAFSELLIKACCSYLNKNSNDARSLLRDNRSIIERICKRCRDRSDADLIIDNISTSIY